MDQVKQYEFDSHEMVSVVCLVFTGWESQYSNIKSWFNTINNLPCCQTALDKVIPGGDTTCLKVGYQKKTCLKVGTQENNCLKVGGQKNTCLKVGCQKNTCL